jgi:hypothetical protein|tara:strand:- start:15 stop:824 length:810 start_codon:yes stop_codon:yes gene_type:complete
VQNKKNILIILLTLMLNTVWAQTELTVDFRISDKVTKTNDFKFSILTHNDTLNVFSSTLNSDLAKNKIELAIERNSLTGLFEYKEENGNWESVKYDFDADTSGLKRIEINLYFSINNSKTEFLQDFTVNKYYQTNSVSIKSGKLKVGSQPVFMLKSNSDTTFYGASPTNHFYGTIKAKTEYGWYDFSGSYCMSTVPEKPLTKSDTVYSWIPNYSPGDEYKIKRPGTYKYVVPMGLERFSDGTPTKMIDKGETRMRIRTFFELETEFKIE